MTANAEILDKLAKLLALANDNENENEAAAAMAAASRLMEQHKIERAEVEVHAASPAPSDTEVEQQTLDDAFKTSVPTWKSCLANGIAVANGCTVFTNRLRSRSRIMRSVRIDIIGTALDVAATKYLYAYASRQIEHFTEVALHAAEHPGRTWANNFRIACVDRVCERYEQASTRNREAARTTASGPALARIESAEDVIRDKLATWSKQLKLKDSRAASMRVDEEAAAAGRAAGDLVDLGNGPAKATLGGGAIGDLADDV